MSPHGLRPALIFSVLTALLTILASCGEPDRPNVTCGAPGATQSCTCTTGSSGAQTCSSGGAWSICECTTCAVDDTQACVCGDGAAGEQTCDANGGWSACLCADPCAAPNECPLTLGEACALDSECDAELRCVTVSEDYEPRTCHASCAPDGPMSGDGDCQSGEVCGGVTTGGGACFDGCTPFLEEGANGCETPGRRLCLPFSSRDRGLCQPSGDVPVGAMCNDGGRDCVGHARCFEEVCRRSCRPFESPSSCSAGEVCQFGTSLFGLCTTNVSTPRRGPYERCDVSGEFCDEALVCLSVASAGGANLCIPLCQTALPDTQCGPGGRCIELDSNEGLGICDPGRLDCEMSDWSAWTCDAVCGPGTETRTRTIDREPLFGGAACGETTETRPCAGPPCHTMNFLPITHTSVSNLGLTVQGQIFTGGRAVVLNDPPNRWRLQPDGTIVLEDDPTMGLALQASVGDNTRVVISTTPDRWRVLQNDHIVLVGPVSCGNHSAASCADCPMGNGAAWCNGDCTWVNNACEGLSPFGLTTLGQAQFNAPLVVHQTHEAWNW